MTRMKSEPLSGVSVLSASLAGAQYGIEAYGQTGDPVFLLHGFTGTARTWWPLSARLGRRYRVWAPDLLGHGRTQVAPSATRFGIDRAAADLTALFDQLRLTRVHVAGYSMGARLALHLALTAPARVASLVLISGSPGLASDAERAARVAADEALAQRVEREGVAAFIEAWQALPLFAGLRRASPAVQDCLRAERLAQRADGLAASLRGMGTGAQPSGWDQLPRLACPVSVIVGAHDSKFMLIGRQMAARLAHGRLVIVPDAGHAVHLEQPVATYRALLQHLQGASPR